MGSGLAGRKEFDDEESGVGVDYSKDVAVTLAGSGGDWAADVTAEGLP